MTAAPRLVVRPAHLLLALLLAAVLVPVLIALVADRLGWGMTEAGAGRMLWSSVVLLGVAAGIAWCSRGWVLDLGLPALAELVLMAAALAASAGFLLSLAGPPLLPVGTSVDGGWHYARSDYVHSGGRLGVYQSRLGNVNAYPPGFHLLVALLAHWSGREPIFTLYPAAVLMFALLVGLAIQVAMDAVAGPCWRLLAGCGALLALMLAPTEATLEIIAREQFYPTAAGMTWLLAGVWGVGLLQRSGHPLALPVLGASAAGIVLFYPFWLAIALGLLAAMIVALRWRMWRRLLIELAVVLGATCAGLLLVHDLLGDQADFVRWDRLRSQAGILALAAAAALPALALCRRLHRWPLLPLVVAGVLATAQYGALNYLRNQPFAEYMAHKTHYLFPYLLAGLAAGVVGAAASKLRRVPALSVGAGGTALALLLGATGLYRQPSGWSGFSPYHPLTPDQVAAGIWMRDHLRPDPENVSFVVDDSITAYWLKTGILRGERGWSASSVQRYAPPHYAHWITDPATPTYALVAGAERAAGPPMRVLFEHGPARVVERVPEARSAQRAVHVQVYSAIEQYAGRPTLRSAAYLSNLPDPAFELRFLLTEQHAGDEPPSVLWDQPLSTHRHAAGRYGLVRLDPAASTAWTWLDGAPRDVPPPVWTPGMALSGWMQLRYHDQPVATRRIYDFVAGDADSFVPRDLNPNSIFHWEPGMPAAAPPERVAGVTLGDRVTLERWDISDDMVAPGAVVALSAQWQAAGPVEPPARLFVHLIDADGRSYPVWDGEPQSGFYPFWLWRPGEQIHDVYQLQIPGDLHAGEYEIVAGIYNPLTGARLPVTGGPASTVAQAGRMGTLVVK